jgi:ribonuclease T1
LTATCAAPAALARDHSAAAAETKEVARAQLPREARQTLDVIKRGGPFAFERDGVVFGNYERRLPLRERGYYREYTVPTPGQRSRGARRIVAGGPAEYYYSDDHYRSFRRIRE